MESRETEKNRRVRGNGGGTNRHDIIVRVYIRRFTHCIVIMGNVLKSHVEEKINALCKALLPIPCRTYRLILHSAQWARHYCRPTSSAKTR